MSDMSVFSTAAINDTIERFQFQSNALVLQDNSSFKASQVRQLCQQIIILKYLYGRMISKVTSRTE